MDAQWAQLKAKKEALDVRRSSWEQRFEELTNRGTEPSDEKDREIDALLAEINELQAEALSVLSLLLIATKGW